MRFGLRNASLVACGALAGCLTTNPALTDSGEEGGDDTSSDTSGSPTSGPGTSQGPTTAGPTTDDPTTDGPTTDGPTTDGPTTGEPTTTATGTDTDPDPTETTGPAACGGDNMCVEAAPPGWSGPVIWAETPVSDDPPSCPAAYPEPAFSAFDDLQAPPAECDCSCGTATGASCATIELESFTNSSCSGSPGSTHSINGTSCQSVTIPGGTTRLRAHDPGVSGGSCTPSANNDIPPATWGSTATVCGGASEARGICDSDALCLARPESAFESRVCVWQPGLLECPAGSFADRFIRHTAVDDDRNCEACTCDAPTGDCTGGVSVRNEAGCSGGGVGTVPIGGTCYAQTSGSMASARGTSLSVSNVSCEPSVGTAVGEAEPDDPYTLCCMTVE